MNATEDKPTSLFTVSGAPAGEKLDRCITHRLPKSLVLQVHHIALGRRLRPATLSWWIRLILKIGAWKNDDPKAKKEPEGFDCMGKSRIKPIPDLAQQIEPTK